MTALFIFHSASKLKATNQIHLRSTRIGLILRMLSRFECAFQKFRDFLIFRRLSEIRASLSGIPNSDITAIPEKIKRGADITGLLDDKSFFLFIFFLWVLPSLWFPHIHKAQVQEFIQNWDTLNCKRQEQGSSCADSWSACFPLLIVCNYGLLRLCGYW